jgi:hypothetical protein
MIFLKYIPSCIIKNKMLAVLNIYRYLLSDVFEDKILISEGKAVPLQAWSGPEVSRKLSFPDFLTTARDGGKVVSLTHRPHLSPGNIPGTHLC